MNKIIILIALITLIGCELNTTSIDADPKINGKYTIIREYYGSTHIYNLYLYSYNITSQEGSIYYGDCKVTTFSQSLDFKYYNDTLEILNNEDVNGLLVKIE